MRVTAAESTELFVGPPAAPLQLVRAHHTACTVPTPVRVSGYGIHGEAVAQPGDTYVEIPVYVDDPTPGQGHNARIGDTAFEFVVAEPGWTMHMISHFHYDPVWWNTQAAYTSLWTEDPPGACRQTNGFDLVTAHLEMARRVPEYKFVLAEVDYLKPFWDTHPEERTDLRRLIDEGRIEIMGGTYNEPNTNLTSPETAIRNFVAGIGFQRHVLGGDPATAWQLDVFGHDPQFPGMAADAGLTSSSWARGPHHQWGPMADHGDPERMQFASEFEWTAPSGRGLLTHYMPAHYAAGWWMDSAPTLADAEAETYRLFTELKKVALTRNVLLPVGTDYTPPNKWVTEIHRDWNARYTWPRFVCALPREFFAAVRDELDQTGRRASVQTRDMNPIYTGKDVSYIDTKQANRAAENAVLEAERFAVFAGVLGGVRYPQAALAKAWVQLAYGAHHDAITGSESDQVYLDLLTGWRDAWEIGRGTRDNALRLLSGAVNVPVVVWNPLAHNRTDIVTAEFDHDFTGVVRDVDGAELPTLIEDGRVSWLAEGVGSLGWQGYRLDGDVRGSRWEPHDGVAIATARHRVTVDPDRGGGVSSLITDGREWIAPGCVGNELAVYAEYSAHPQAGEGPWHLLPRGPVTTSAEHPAAVQLWRCALGERLVVTGHIGDVVSYTQTITVWHGVERIEYRTVIDGFTGSDDLLRLRWPCPVPGAMPVSEVGDAVIGRGFGLFHDGDEAVDAAVHPFTLDNPAYGWFGLSATLRVRVGEHTRAISVAEVVVGDDDFDAREVMVALVRTGVTATCTVAGQPRYGDLAVDSNLPDARLAIGGPDENGFTAAVLACAPEYRQEFDRQLSATGAARVWVPAVAPLGQEWVPGADLRGERTLPVLVIAGGLTALIDDIADAEIAVSQQTPAGMEPFESATVALLNRGVPGFAVEPDGSLHTSLMRSCTGWPSGTWIDPPRRTAPDGSNFGLQHWTHTFDYALVAGSGDWRDREIPRCSAEFGHPLIAVVNRRAGADLLPAHGALLDVDAEGVQLGALKAAGNPMTAGALAGVDAGSVAMRLVETHGRQTPFVIRSGICAVSGMRQADLLENEAGPVADTLHGYQIATMLAHLDAVQILHADNDAIGPESEAAQPVYARYWLHNRGPAPLGGLPAVAHVHPRQAQVQPGAQLPLRLTAASDCTDAALRGRIRLSCPPQWSADPDEVTFVLPPGEYLDAEVAVAVPAAAPPGLYPVRVELALTGGRGLPAAWRQVVEDVCLVQVGQADRAAEGQVLRLVDGPAEVRVRPGGQGRLSVTVGTDARADLSVEAHLISPWGTWEWLGPAVIGAELPAQGRVTLDFDVSPPPWVAPGRWWALVRVAAAGTLVYSPAVTVVVT
ncbi:NEW3 domain-containing protein [Mycolicibacterium neoaurum]|uniref:glycoside hydrolase family 38 N-terminal domain-containing protein n=1 Tax=Mycolicibacterium neoaurum TaxID=1795 RepID=UPI002670DD36|nr:NEW3 domain-containing protein [Mycolicibacterium neoaurum]MDO3400758.1 NEW3 domain-containing protein [Mycolicibacterium neoaurum]